MSAKLIYSDSQTLLASLALTGEAVRIGRGAGCQLRVSDPSVGDEHCALHQEGDIWVVESLAGAGTFVNAQEQPVSKHPLRSRDLIRCGGLWIQFIVDEAPALTQVEVGAELPGTVQNLLATAASELLQQKALTRFLQEEKDALRTELLQLKSGTAAAQPSGADVDRLQQELTELRETVTSLRKAAEPLESELSTLRRELSLSQSELGQATAKLAAAAQQVKDQEAATAHLLNENKSLVVELEHLRTILSHKDQVIEEAREVPQSMMAELVAVRRQCEELTEQRKWLEAERDAAQIELSRRALALAHAEEELRRLRHQSELHERLLATSHSSGAELARAVQHNSALTIELTQAREKLAMVKEQLALCLKAISLVVIELGVKVYALRAAIARQSLDAETGKAVNDTMEQILLHLNDGNVQLQALRKLTDEVSASPPASAAQVLS